MKSRFFLPLWILFSFPFLYGQPDGFKPLFNGVDLEGWWGLSTENPASWMNLSPSELAEKRNKSLENINKHWHVEDGILINDGKGLYLTTLENFSDFELRLEYNTVAKADSGVYLRGYPQVQIWDTTEAGGTGQKQVPVAYGITAPRKDGLPWCTQISLLENGIL